MNCLKTKIGTTNLVNFDKKGFVNKTPFHTTILPIFC